MIERGVNTPINELKLTEYKHKISNGLELEKANFLKIPDRVRENVINTIATDLIDLSKYLNIPLPEVGLTLSWEGNNGNPNGESVNYSIRDIIANASVDDQYPDGIIRYSPFYLKSFISYKLGIEQDIETPPLPLSLVNGHEAFHLWQYKNQKEQVLRDAQVFKNEDLSAWNLTRTEIDAREFEKRWLEIVYNLPYS